MPRFQLAYDGTEVAFDQSFERERFPTLMNISAILNYSEKSAFLWIIWTIWKTKVCLNAAVYIAQAALVEFDIEEELAEKFSRILPSALLLIVLPFMVLRLIGKLIIWAILITFSFGRCWSLSLWAGLCSWNGTVPLFITRWLQFSCLRCLTSDRGPLPCWILNHTSEKRETGRLLQLFFCVFP